MDAEDAEDDFIAGLIQNPDQEPEAAEEEKPPPAPIKRGKWNCPPVDEIPLKYQKNKLYFQVRIDSLPEGNLRPRITIGFCREDYKEDKELARQDKVWGLSMHSGDKLNARHWKTYYVMEGGEGGAEPEFGLFSIGTIVGVLLDMDRGVINFYKDGNDLGQAFAQEELKSGGLFPLIQTKVPCQLSVFHPSVWPWVLEVPEEPVPPPEPSREEDYWSVDEEAEALEPSHVSVPEELDETEQWILEQSMEQEDQDQLLEFEKHVAAIDRAKIHKLRQSHRFQLVRTKGNLIPRESQNKRNSLKYKHKDLYLDAHTRHIRQVKA